MIAPTEAFPLAWPINRPRSTWAQESRFKTTLGVAIREVQNEVARLGGSNLIISSNLPTRQDGMPYANARQPQDRGVDANLRVITRSENSRKCNRFDSEIAWP
jgi:hypothetical protein